MQPNYGKLTLRFQYFLIKPNKDYTYFSTRQVFGDYLGIDYVGNLVFIFANYNEMHLHSTTRYHPTKLTYFKEWFR